MAIKTRETTADGVTNNNAPLTNAELDNNFVELQQNKADLSGADFTGDIDVTGTVTADGLTVDGNGKLSSATPILRFSETDTTDLNTVIKNAGGDFFIETENDAESTRTSRLSIDHSTGDISFYEATGTNASFVYDASTQLVVNEDSRDFDFRVESNNYSSLFAVRGTEDCVNLGGTGNYVSGSAARVQIAATSQTPALNQANPTGASLLVSNADVSYGTMFATNTAGTGFIQQRRTDATDAYYSLCLQPYGGAVGIGNAAPSKALDINGEVRIASTADDAISINAGAGGYGFRVKHEYGFPWSTTQLKGYSGGSGWRSVLSLRTSDGAGTDVYNADFYDNLAVFNEGGVDMDFRVESDTTSHALYVDGASGTVCVNTSNPSPGSGGIQIMPRNGVAMGTSYGDAYYPGAFYYNNDLKGSIYLTTSGVTYNTTSDRRLKDNIETITDGTDKLMAMNPVTHTWKADPEADAVHGFIAQEMQEIVPEAVSGDPDGEEMMSMDYGRITPVIVAALQDAHKKIEELSAEIAALKGDK